MQRFFAAMDDEFNTPLAIGALFDGVAEVNRTLSSGETEGIPLPLLDAPSNSGSTRFSGSRSSVRAAKSWVVRVRVSWLTC